MAEWIKWGLGFLVPALLAHAVWATRTILRLNQKVFGADGTNGLSSQTRDLIGWREELRAELPELLRHAKHDAIDAMTGPVGEVSNYTGELDARLRLVEGKLEHARGVEETAEAFFRRLEKKR